MNNLSNLKQCPFCGSNAHKSKDERGIVCTSCGAKMQYELDPNRSVSGKAWNTRAIDNLQPEPKPIGNTPKCLEIAESLLDDDSYQLYLDKIKDVSSAEPKPVEAVGEWLDMESAPHGIWILISSAHGSTWQACWNCKGFWHTEGGMRIYPDITNGWMPLPKPKSMLSAKQDKE